MDLPSPGEQMPDRHLPAGTVLPQAADFPPRAEVFGCIGELVAPEELREQEKPAASRTLLVLSQVLHTAVLRQKASLPHLRGHSVGIRAVRGCSSSSSNMRQ